MEGADEATQERLIPAGAGQTDLGSMPFRGEWAHPRGCGADANLLRHLIPVAGSSPRVRGRLCVRLKRPPACGAHPRGCGADHIQVVGALRGDGLIPAGAGQTSTHLRASSSVTAHPRGCGADFRPWPG